MRTRFERRRVVMGDGGRVCLFLMEIGADHFGNLGSRHGRLRKRGGG